jgi:hypothetical protein
VVPVKAMYGGFRADLNGPLAVVLESPLNSAYIIE